VPIWPDRQSKRNVMKVKIAFSEMCWRVDLNKASMSIDCCKLDLMDHRWPNVMIIWKFWFQSDFYVHIRIALIYNTFLVIARTNRPNKQREAKPSILVRFSWHTSKLSSLILWNARVKVSQSCSCLERAHHVCLTRYSDDTFGRLAGDTFGCLISRPLIAPRPF
jgi:hypothetical protein